MHDQLPTASAGPAVGPTAEPRWAGDASARLGLPAGMAACSRGQRALAACTESLLLSARPRCILQARAQKGPKVRPARTLPERLRLPSAGLCALSEARPEDAGQWRSGVQERVGDPLSGPKLRQGE